MQRYGMDFLDFSLKLLNISYLKNLIFTRDVHELHCIFVFLA